MVSEGAKFVMIQHGGGFGTTKCFALEEYHKNISNFFITWGWKKDQKKDLLLPSTISINKSKIIKKIRPKKNFVAWPFTT